MAIGENIRKRGICDFTFAYKVTKVYINFKKSMSQKTAFFGIFTMCLEFFGNYLMSQKNGVTIAGFPKRHYNCIIKII